MKANIILAGILALSLTGCAQKLIAGNEVGGQVRGDDSMFSEPGGAMRIADEHCKKFGKLARVSSQDPLNSTLSFDCVKP